MELGKGVSPCVGNFFVFPFSETSIIVYSGGRLFMTRRLQAVQLAIAATNAVEASRLFSFIGETRKV
jgi:hypothetical protein